jgi:hypothetical protein
MGGNPGGVDFLRMKGRNGYFGLEFFEIRVSVEKGDMAVNY